MPKRLGNEDEKENAATKLLLKIVEENPGLAESEILKLFKEAAINDEAALKAMARDYFNRMTAH